MKKVYQYRYYGENENKNTEGMSLDSLASGAAFSSKMPILQLGVQSLPGTKFYINNGINPVIVGSIGSISIDFSNGGEIEKSYGE